MVLRGMFTDLAWENFPHTHKKYWEILENRYAISANLFNFSSQKSLEDLAQKCIHICRQHLFSLHSYPWNYELPAGWRPWTPNAYLATEKLEEKLTGALCDHLIVTFAYYFYLENLEHRPISECLKEVFCCKKLFPQIPNTLLTKDERREAKRDFVKVTWEKYQNFVKSTQKAVARYQKVLENSDISEAILKYNLTSENLMENFGVPKSVPNSKEACYLGIDWLFKLSMACNWVNSPFSVKGENFAIEKERDNWMERLARFIADNSWSRLLLKEQNDSRRLNRTGFYPASKYAKDFELRTIPILGLRLAETVFSAIACDVDETYDHALPSQSYTIRGSQARITIPADLQFVINCYLLEGTFHGYALSTVVDWMGSNLFDSSYGPFIYNQLLLITRLRAPLIHVPIMELMCDVTFEDRKTYPFMTADARWIGDYIDYWNSTALPILEETFLWAIQSQYSFEEVFTEIEKSIMKSEGIYRRCDRLNFYRLIPKATSKDHIESYDKEMREQLSALFDAAYLSGIGYKGYFDGMTQFDAGLCTAFD